MMLLKFKSYIVQVKQITQNISLFNRNIGCFQVIAYMGSVVVYDARAHYYTIVAHGSRDVVANTDSLVTNVIKRESGSDECLDCRHKTLKMTFILLMIQ